MAIIRMVGNKEGLERAYKAWRERWIDKDKNLKGSLWMLKWCREKR